MAALLGTSERFYGKQYELHVSPEGVALTRKGEVLPDDANLWHSILMLKEFYSVRPTRSVLWVAIKWHIIYPYFLQIYVNVIEQR